jgi:hypothetical protein
VLDTVCPVVEVLVVGATGATGAIGDAGDTSRQSDGCPRVALRLGHLVRPSFCLLVVFVFVLVLVLWRLPEMTGGCSAEVDHPVRS